MDLGKKQLASKEGVLAYLRQFGSTEPLALLSIARQAFEEFIQRKPLRSEAAHIPFALGWAHAMDWLPQPDIDSLIDIDGCDQDVILMKWEDGKCEALESLCAREQEIEDVWAACRIGSPGGAAKH